MAVHSQFRTASLTPFAGVTLSHDTSADAVVGGGSFKLLAPDGNVNVSGNFICLSGTNGVNIVGTNAGIGLNNTITIAGDVLLNGGLCTGSNTTNFTIVDPRLDEPTSKPVAAGAFMHIVNNVGSIKANMQVTAQWGIYTTGQVIGGDIGRIGEGDEQHVTPYPASGNYTRMVTLFQWMGINTNDLLYGIDHVGRECSRIMCV